jgi:hypothetical protein
VSLDAATPNYSNNNNNSIDQGSLTALRVAVGSRATIYLGPWNAASVAGAVVSANPAVANLSDAEKERQTLLFDHQHHLEISSLFGLKQERIDSTIVEQTLIWDLVRSHFLPILNKVYPVIDPQQLRLDIRTKRLPPNDQFFVVLAAAIAAAHQARSSPNLATVSLVLRRWADTLVPKVLERHDDDAIQAITLLIMYELVDPTRKQIWQLLGFASRMMVRLRWRPWIDGSDLEPAEPSPLSTTRDKITLPETQFHRYPAPRRARLQRTIYTWERYASSTTICRPTR